MKQFKKRFTTMLLSATLAIGSLGVQGGMQGIVSKAATGSEVAISNAGFEESSYGTPSSWYGDGKVVSGGQGGSNHCLKLENNSEKSSYLRQVVYLKPDTEYMISGWIKGENIKEHRDGATIEVDQEDALIMEETNSWKCGSFDWTYTTVSFKTKPETSAFSRVRINCRLGHIWSTTSGTAYFDNIKIVEKKYDSTERIMQKGTYTTANMKKTTVAAASNGFYPALVNKLDQAYVAYEELVGARPWKGAMWYIRDTDQPMVSGQYGAISNYNPIIVANDQEKQFQLMDKGNFVNFGYLHEMGHTFDSNLSVNGKDINGQWNFDGEFWTNTKMIYVVDKTDLVVAVGANSTRRCATLNDLSDYYKTSYNDKIVKGEYSGDGLSYIFIKIVNKIGWDPFKKTFREYLNDENGINSKLAATGSDGERFDTFLATLQKNYNPNGREVYDVFGAKDLATVRNHFWNHNEMISGGASMNMAGSSVNGSFENGVYTVGATPYFNLQNFDLKVKEENGTVKSGIEYRIYQNGRWSNWAKDGASCGTKGADSNYIQIRLTGDLAEEYNICYQTIVYGGTWTDWSMNGGSSGDASRRLEGIHIKLVDRFNTDETDVHSIWMSGQPNLIDYKFSSTNLRVNETVKLDLEIGNVLKDAKCRVYARGGNYSTGSKDRYFTMDSNTSGTWTPDMEGTYSILASVIQNGRAKILEICNNLVVGKEGNITTIYYKASSTTNIHYRVGNGAWTNVPGVAMQKSSEKSGYYKAEISLGENTKLTACFNDGNNHWDNNNNQNYHFGVGTYYVADGKITEKQEEKELTIASVVSSKGDVIKYKDSTNITVNATGGAGDYKYTVSYTLYGSGRTSYVLNNSTSNTGVFTPDYAKAHTLSITVTDAKGNTASTTKVIEAREVTENTITVYYKASRATNIHYRVGNGAWTNVPGVAMQKSSEKSGYYKAEISLGENTELTACFNDGNNHWDNNNNQNYHFGVGTYYVTDGKITEKPEEKELTIASVVSSKGDVIKYKDSTNITVNATGGAGDYKYTVSYTLYGSGRIGYVLNNSTSNTGVFTPDYAKAHTLSITVTDAKGNTASTTKVIEAREVTENTITVYYKASRATNIHYCVGNGSWTTAPGVAMKKASEKSGYYKYVVNLGQETTMTACFNDGKNWDNNNNKNYYFNEPGTYTVVNK